jgi:hypothetical protein
MVIDTSFDVRTDAGGKDADTFSPTLCRYHRLLWGKPMPGGIRFELSLDTPIGRGVSASEHENALA